MIGSSFYHRQERKASFLQEKIQGTQTRRMFKNLNQDGKKIQVASDRKTRFNQDIFQDEIEERNTKRKTILYEDEIDFESGCYSDEGIQNGNSHSSYVVAQFKL